MSSFSRRTRVQEKRSSRRGWFYIISAIVIFILFINFGIPLAGRLAEIIGSTKKSDSTNQLDGKISSIAPQLDTLPQFTQDNSIVVTGRATIDSTLKIYRNGNVIKDSIIDQSGNYSLTINLSDGENHIWATSSDKNKTESEKSKEFLVISDHQPPTLEVTTPLDGDNLYGANNKTITVTGKTEKDSQLTVNDHLAIVNDDGSFSTKIGLNEGSNELNFVSTDQAENKTEKKITVTFSP